MVIIALIIFILSIYQLYSIRKTSGYSQSTSLQNAYDFSIGVLVLNVFVFIFFVAAIGIYIRNKQKRSGSLVTVIIFATLTLFGGIIVGGYAAAASKNGAAIGNLVTMIIGFLISIFLIFSLRKLDVYVPPDVAAKCGEITHQTAAAQLSSVANQYLTPENIQTAAKLGELL
jgi:disulfide bond formation protein DsbB